MYLGTRESQDTQTRGGVGHSILGSSWDTRESRDTGVDPWDVLGYYGIPGYSDKGGEITILGSSWDVYTWVRGKGIDQGGVRA